MRYTVLPLTLMASLAIVACSEPPAAEPDPAETATQAPAPDQGMEAPTPEPAAMATVTP